MYIRKERKSAALEVFSNGFLLLTYIDTTRNGM